nr:hypothetical protein 4 [Bacillaceae bacterium]
MGWALDDGEDIGGQFADHEHWMDMQLELAGIKEDRKRRVRELAGKFVVATKGRSSDKITFYQDRRVSKGGYWTQYLSNALGFTTLGEAKTAGGFKYGNPRVAIVTFRGNLSVGKLNKISALFSMVKEVSMKGSTKYQLLKDDFNHACNQLKIKNKLINELREENELLKAQIQYENYLYKEEEGYSNDLLKLLEKCLPSLIKQDGTSELSTEIKKVIEAASV